MLVNHNTNVQYKEEGLYTGVEGCRVNLILNEGCKNCAVYIFYNKVPTNYGTHPYINLRSMSIIYGLFWATVKTVNEF